MISVLRSASERAWVLCLISFPGAVEAVEERVSRCLGCSEKSCVPPGTDCFAQTRMLWPVWLIDRGEERGSVEKFAMMKRDSSRGFRCGEGGGTGGKKKVLLKNSCLPFTQRGLDHLAQFYMFVPDKCQVQPLFDLLISNE